MPATTGIRIAVIGGGGWGLALAALLARKDNRVVVWEFNPDFLSSLQKTRSNPALLPGVILPEIVTFTGDWAFLADFAPELIVISTPSQFIRSTLLSVPDELRSRLYQACRALLIVAKGVELGSGLLLTEVLKQVLSPDLHDRIYALSGPSHAEEVSRGIPTTVVIAGAEEETLQWLQEVFSNQYFRAYRSRDLIGVEIGGAVKNIIAIAAGMVKGLGYGDNTIGALLTRGIVEIQRLGVAMGAKAETFLGLSGIGDLITTATSEHSRNRYVGFEIGKGRKLSELLSSMQMVAEGVATTRSVYELAQSLGVEMPIVDQVYRILYEDVSPQTAIQNLMLRQLKPE